MEIGNYMKDWGNMIIMVIALMFMQLVLFIFLKDVNTRLSKSERNFLNILKKYNLYNK